MSFAETAALGAIAGLTIFLGLPIGRAEGLSARARVGLSMLSAGILAFLFMDVGAEGLGIIETHLDAFKAHEASLWPVVGLSRCSAPAFSSGSAGSRRSSAGWGRPRATGRRSRAPSRRWR